MRSSVETSPTHTHFLEAGASEEDQPTSLPNINSPEQYEPQDTPDLCMDADSDPGYPESDTDGASSSDQEVEVPAAEMPTSSAPLYPGAQITHKMGLMLMLSLANRH